MKAKRGIKKAPFNTKHVLKITFSGHGVGAAFDLELMRAARVPSCHRMVESQDHSGWKTTPGSSSPIPTLSPPPGIAGTPPGLQTQPEQQEKIPRNAQRRCLEELPPCWRLCCPLCELQLHPFPAPWAWTTPPGWEHPVSPAGPRVTELLEQGKNQFLELEFPTRTPLPVLILGKNRDCNPPSLSDNCILSFWVPAVSSLFHSV